MVLYVISLIFLSPQRTSKIKNIYANIEWEKKPLMIDFNLSNPRQWAPLHSATDAQPSVTLMTIQDRSLHYAPQNHRYARELSNELKETIKSAVRGWRRSATSFRSDVGNRVTLILEKLEQARVEGQQIEHVDSVLPETVTKTRKVFGFPLHFPFTNVQNVLDAIEATEIHRNRNPRVEFALGVRVFPYPGGLLSVWVFVCSLVPTS